MPNYSYKCPSCDSVEQHFLPISTDPGKKLQCSVCSGPTHRIITTMGEVKGLKVFAGDWFKKTYGHELGEDGMTQLERRQEFEKAVKEHKKDNS